jgi:hypothetical protein
MCNKCHRNAPDIPTDPIERKKMVTWLLEHPLWIHPTKPYKIPPPDMIFDTEKYMRHEYDDSDWPEEMDYDGSIHECVEFGYHYVNPVTERIEDDDSLNTLFQIWAEDVGGWYDASEDDNTPEPPEGWDCYNKWRLGFDLRLECGGNTMEDCLLELAVRVKAFYNDDGTNKNNYPCESDEWDDRLEEYKSVCVDDGEGYCKNCGFPMDY